MLYGCLLLLYSMVALKGDGADFVMFSFLWVMIALISACIMFGILGIVTGEGIGMLLERSGDLRTCSALAAAALKFSLGRLVLAIH